MPIRSPKPGTAGHSGFASAKLPIAQDKSLAGKRWAMSSWQSACQSAAKQRLGSEHIRPILVDRLNDLRSVYGQGPTRPVSVRLRD